MAINIALNHVTEYRYDRRINLGPKSYACALPRTAHLYSGLFTESDPGKPLYQLAAGS
ncbi:Uncharacterised protein [Serratia plymuthica]|nr:Uncharacterised protein [Serratia plymuthica]